jgi:hypothetical protein
MLQQNVSYNFRLPPYFKGWNEAAASPASSKELFEQHCSFVTADETVKRNLKSARKWATDTRESES